MGEFAGSASGSAGRTAERSMSVPYSHCAFIILHSALKSSRPGGRELP